MWVLKSSSLLRCLTKGHRGCNVIAASCGGVTHWALVKEEDDTIMTIAFGQGAGNGELGLGPDEPKSATKPTQNKILAGIHILQ